MSLLVVGSLAFDTIQTPYGKVEKCLGGSATYFSLAASYFTEVRVVGVVGDVKARNLRAAAAPGVYLALSQFSYGANYLVLETAGDSPLGRPVFINMVINMANTQFARGGDYAVEIVMNDQHQKSLPLRVQIAADN